MVLRLVLQEYWRWLTWTEEEDKKEEGSSIMVSGCEERESKKGG